MTSGYDKWIYNYNKYGKLYTIFTRGTVEKPADTPEACFIIKYIIATGDYKVIVAVE